MSGHPSWQVERTAFLASYVLSLGEEGERRWHYDAEWHAQVYVAALHCIMLYRLLGVVPSLASPPSGEGTAPG